MLRVFIRELFGALDRAGIDYAVVGDVAVNLHGVPRMTYDVDLMVATHAASLRDCRIVLEQLGLRSRLPFVLELERNLVAVTFTDPVNPLREVDILVAPSLDPDGVVRRAVRRGTGASAVRVASVEDLIAMKRRAGRAQDLADIAHLEKLARGPAT